VDLGLYARVIWRFRVLVAGGLVLAIVLATLSFVKPVLGSGGIKLQYRSGETFESRSTVFVTQDGFPWGRSVTPQAIPATPDEPEAPGPKFADPGRYASLAILYSHLANSDEVRQVILRDGPLKGTYVAAAVPSDDGNGYTPFINLTASSPTAAGARAVADRAARGLQRYVRTEQAANRITSDERIEVPLVQKASAPVVTSGRRPTKPALIFIVVMMATLGFAFLLENLRPGSSARVGPDPPEALEPPDSAPNVMPDVSLVPRRAKARSSA
jgi:hypothetical protein